MIKRPSIIDDVATSGIKTRVVCIHSYFVRGVCICCGRKYGDDTALVSAYNSAIPLDYQLKYMRVSKFGISQIKYKNTKNLLSERKLYLVLDLDSTLLHSIPLLKKDPAEVRDLLDQVENSPKGDLFHLSSINIVTKLRPFVREFLEEANTLFKMYIYTMGNRCYADAIARLLDPKGVYFRRRVIAKEDCTQPKQKGLDVVLGQERAVLIMDDQERAWPDNKENLIVLEKYQYFSVEKSGEESDGTLAKVLEDLKKTHTEFFMEFDQAKDEETDVRTVLKVVRDGCES